MLPLDEFVTEKLETPTSTRKNGVVIDWVNKRCRTVGTKQAYYSALLNFLRSVYGEHKYPSFPSHSDPAKKQKVINDGIERYLNENRDFLEDFNSFILWLNKNKYAPMTSHTHTSMVKKFFSRHGHKLSDDDWEDLRGLLAPNKPRTQDKILTKEQFRSMLSHLGIYMRALALFLGSTGARVGETLKLKIADLELDKDPPQVNIRPQYTKKELGGRVMWFSYEARDAIKEWLKVKDSRKKKTGHLFPKEMVFGIALSTTEAMWVNALKKAGLDQRDESTKKRMYIYHIHTIRKFFRTRMALANVPDMIVHGWMGHSAYLAEAYDRPEEELTKLYLDHMDAVSVYGSGTSSEFKKKLEAIEKESKQDKEELRKVNEMLNKLGISNDRPLEERLLEYFRLTQTKQTSQPIKSETNIPSEQPKSSETVIEKPKPLPVPTKPLKQNPDLVYCPNKEDWIHKVYCGTCKTTNWKMWKDCQRKRVLNPNDPIFQPTKPKPLA